MGIENDSFFYDHGNLNTLVTLLFCYFTNSQRRMESKLRAQHKKECKYYTKTVTRKQYTLE